MDSGISTPSEGISTPARSTALKMSASSNNYDGINKGDQPKIPGQEGSLPKDWTEARKYVDSGNGA